MEFKASFIKVARRLFSWFRSLILALGVFCFILVLIAFTRLPYEAQRWLGDTDASYNFSPDYIIFLGGSGMPSESNLIRLYYVEQLASNFPSSKIIITHPYDSATAEEMSKVLVQMGVDKVRINKMVRGTNTREQALELKNSFSDLTMNKIVIVTSPENMYRTIKVFKNLNFLNVGGVSAYENAMYVDLTYNLKKVGGKDYVPDISSYMGIRYNFWNYLKLEITCLREFAAIIFYQLNGWI
ncbi:MAG: YdcF family protein [Bacteroidetes bacterium]|nr:YdcF family protein [Bacteroidota bacterium]